MVAVEIRSHETVQMLTVNPSKDLGEELDVYCASTSPMLRETAGSEDDDSSVLNLDEYSPKTWTEIVSYGVPTVGIAVLALTHPVLFLALSLVGMGGAYATGAADYASICGKGSTKDKDDKRLVPHELVIETVVSSLSCDEACAIENVIIEPETEVVEEVEDVDDNVIPAPLAHMILDNARFSSLHAKDFFQIFFGDEAPFSFKDFQKQRGDVDIVYSAWGESNQRVLTFLTPTRTPFLGPSHANATKIQTLKHMTKRCIVMESRTSLQDIPFSDRFAVLEQWIFTSDEEKMCTLRVTAQVVFSKPCAFETQIVTKSMSSLQEVLGSWSEMAQKALALTAQRRREEDAAAAATMTTVPVKFDDEIEVAYQSQRRRSCIVGEDEEDDWEMDPIPSASTVQPKKRTFRSIRKSMSPKFMKKQ